MNYNSEKLGLAAKIVLCGAMIYASLWYRSYINAQHYQFAGYANFSQLMLTGHVPMLALVPDALRGAWDVYDECSGGACGDMLWVLEVILRVFMACLNLAMWTLGTFGIFIIHKKWALWIVAFYLATIVINVGNIIVFGVGTM